MTRQTEVELLDSTPEGRLNLAAASFANTAASLMRRALAASGKQAQEVAQDMLVTPGRISQLLAANGNVKVSTLARFMEACGYELKLTAVPKREGLPSLEQPTRGRRPAALPESNQPDFVLGHGISEVKLAVASKSDFYQREFEDLRPSLPMSGWAVLVTSADVVGRAHWRNPSPTDCRFESSVPTSAKEMYAEERV